MLRHLLVVCAQLILIAMPMAKAAEVSADGVPLPSDAAIAEIPPSATSLQRQWSGAWVGAWGGTLKHILLVERIDRDGAARVVYAVGDNPYAGTRAQWMRSPAIASGDTLTLNGTGFTATYQQADDGQLNASYRRGSIAARAAMTRADLPSLMRAGAPVAWTRGTSLLVQTDLIEDGRQAILETVIFKPPGAGPFPLAVFNHGSTGAGRRPELFKETWFSTEIADLLNKHGWLVAFPQRRGRGRSDGLYDEGFFENRSLGYTCDADNTLRGADRALADIDAAVRVLRQWPDVAAGPILIGGQSRGGVLSVAYAGMHREQTFGVINFVGGWLGEGCPTAEVVNQALFERGARYRRPTIWLYGEGDRLYSIAHSLKNFAAFENAGGQGKFLTFDVPGGAGHTLLGHPDLWSGPVDDYLSLLTGSR